MSAAVLLRRASDQGVMITLDAGRLHLQASAPPHLTLVAEIKENRDAIITHLSRKQHPETAADWKAAYAEKLTQAQADDALPSDKANARAYMCIEMEWINQNTSASSNGQCIGCGGHASADKPLIPFGLEPHLSWLHARCWSDWFRGRRQVAQAALKHCGIARPW